MSIFMIGVALMKLHLPDLLAILLVLALAGMCAAFVFMGESGASVLVSANGYTYPLLMTDGVHVIESAGYHFTIEISDGSCNVTESDCPDALCAAMPAIRRAGEVIICVPAKLSLRVDGSEKGAIDGVAG